MSVHLQEDLTTDTDLVEVNHEGGQSYGDTLEGADAGEDAVSEPNDRCLGRDVAAHVGHEHNHCHLQVTSVRVVSVRTVSGDDIKNTKQEPSQDSFETTFL